MGRFYFVEEENCWFDAEGPFFTFTLYWISVHHDRQTWYMDYRKTWRKKNVRIWDALLQTSSFFTSWTEHRTNTSVLEQLTIQRCLLRGIKKRKSSFFGHVSRWSTTSDTTLQRKTKGLLTRGRQRLKWTDNIKEWTRRTIVQCRVTSKTGRSGKTV